MSYQEQLWLYNFLSPHDLKKKEINGIKNVEGK